MTRSIYSPLGADSDNASFRLITLHPSEDPSAPVQCTLKEHYLANSNEYEALSYCWGEQADRLAIFCDGQPLKATRNLEAALRCLRRASQCRLLWVDAVCINQDDTPEKESQVSIMREIYRKASNVIVWLGEEGDNSNIVFSLCERMVTYRLGLLKKGGIGSAEHAAMLWGPDRQQMLQKRLKDVRSDNSKTNMETCEDEEDLNLDKTDPSKDFDPTDKEVTAFLKLLKRPWFTRCWVIQEICVAQAATVVCGKSSLDWDSFYCGFVLAIILGEEGLQGRPEQLLRGSLIMMNSIRSSLATDCDEPEPEVRRNTFLELLWLARPLYATKEVDKVYSLLGLIAPGEAKRLRLWPNYNITPVQCYTETALSILQDSQNLDLLMTERMIDPAQAFVLPSWVPNWSYVATPTPTEAWRDDKSHGGHRPASPSQTKSTARPFCASGSCATYHVALANPSTIVLSGYVFDRILITEKTLTVPPADQEMIQNSTTSLSAVGSLLLSLFSGLGDYFETLVLWEKLALDDKYTPYPNGQDPTWVYATTLCWDEAPNGPTALIGDYQKWRTMIRGPKQLSLLKKLGMHRLDRIWKVSMGLAGTFTGFKNVDDRRFATATERTLCRRLARLGKGYLGVVPAESQPGDAVALFRGAEMPLVIRARGSGWELIGPAYIHGIMYGEGWDESRSGEMHIS